MEGAAQVPTGKGQKTFKSQSQSGLFCPEFDWILRINNKAIPMDDINALLDDEFTFKDHMEAVGKMGFTLNVKRARIGKNKHIRVRPQFDSWSSIGEITITDTQITKEILQQILEIAGQYKGMCDWRPGSPTPGPWGMFKAELK
jgi:hypothetical protein